MTVRAERAVWVAALASAERETRSREILESFRDRVAGRASSRGDFGRRASAGRVGAHAGHAAACAVARRTAHRAGRTTKSQIVDDLRAWNESHQHSDSLCHAPARGGLRAWRARIALDAGKVVAQGTPHEVLQRPELETVAQLAGFENVFDARLSRDIPSKGYDDDRCRRCRALDIDLEVPLSRIDRCAATARRNSCRRHFAGVVRSRGIERAKCLRRGRSARLQQRDVMVVAQIDCGRNLKCISRRQRGSRCS